MHLFVKKKLSFSYKVLKKIVREMSYWLHSYACYINGRQVWNTVKHNTNEVVSDRLLKEHKQLWRPLSKVVPSVFIKAYVGLTGVKSKDFIPENIYYTIVEPILNNPIASAGYEDKAQIDWFHNDEYLPVIYLRNIHGVYYDKNRNELAKPILSFEEADNGKIIVKPSIDSQGGRNIFIFSFKDNEWKTRKGDVLTIKFLEQHFKQNFIVQEYVEQHPFFRQFNESSVNTLRVMTYRSVKDNKMHVLHAVLRVGKDGNEIDNQSLGGYACGIQSNGVLRAFVADKYGATKQTLAKGTINLSEVGKVYMIEEVKEVARKLAKCHFHSRILGFDLCVDKNSRVKLIEVNNMDIGMELTQHLVGPLFREFTNEVIDYCKERFKTFKYQIV